MSDTTTESQVSDNQNLAPSESVEQQLATNDNCTERQLQSAFLPPTVTFVFTSIFFFVFIRSLID